MLTREEQLKSDIEAMESAFTNPTTEEGVASGLQETDKVDNDAQLKADRSITTEAITEEVEVKEKKKYTNWKKRFTNLKTSQDATIHRLRLDDIRKSDEVDSLRATVDKLQAAIMELKNVNKDNIFEGAISPEEAEILGPEAVGAISKVTQAAIDNAVSPIKQELKDAKEVARKAELARTESKRINAQVSFLQRLGNIVEDYAEIDHSEKFHTFMKEVDPMSGEIRQKLFKDAEYYGDVGRVAGFFKEFKEATKALNPILEKQITPENNGVGTTAVINDNTPVSVRTINQFWDDRSRGKYKGKESEAIKLAAEYDMAVQTGNIVP